MISSLSIFMIILSASFNSFNIAAKADDSFISEFFIFQEAPFYFLKPVPPTIKLPNKIDLSFFRNQSVVSEYRYRLEIPAGGATAIDRNFTRWSPWISFDFIEFSIPMLDMEGGYKLNIEYRSSKGSEILKFEKLFYVYRVNPGSYSENPKSETAVLFDKTVTKTNPAADKPNTITQPATSKTTSKTTPLINLSSKRVVPVIDKIIIKSNPIAELAKNNFNLRKAFENDKQTFLQNANGIVTQKTMSIVKYTSNEPVKKIIPTGIIDLKEHNHLLAESIERRDAALFKKLILDEAEIVLKGPDGGNIFHLMNDSISNDEVISILKKEGIPLDETDNNGNSPLHIAILGGESEYALSLINQGAGLNIRNKLELSPLHLAALLNDREVANHLLQKGAEIDIKGNSGYTPLHIASELNHVRLAKDLLLKGANTSVKTDQKLTSKAIAKIQNNSEMTKLIDKKGSYILNLPISSSTRSTTFLNSVKLSPKYDFSLPYNKNLVKRRQFNKLLRNISIPALAISTAGAAYLRTVADHNYSLYKGAETIEMAQHYYDKTMQYDTFTYISVGVSLVSVFGIIHSAVKQKSISNKMYKALY